MRLLKGSIAGAVLAGILTMVPAPGLMGQTTVHIAQAPVGRVQVPRVQVNLTPQHPANSSNVRIAGFPSGPTQLPYLLVSKRSIGKTPSRLIGENFRVPDAPLTGPFTRG